MNDVIKKQFDLISPLHKSTWQELLQIAIERSILKNEKLATEGIPFNYEIFLVKGILRSFYVTPEGKEYTTSFCNEGSFVSPVFTRQSEGKSLLHIEALENSKLILFEEVKFTELRYRFKDLFILGSKVTEGELQLKSLKELLLATSNIKQLYFFFQEKYPDLEKKISQKHIASFMGVDPVSLSRIKSRVLKERS